MATLTTCGALPYLQARSTTRLPTVALLFLSVKKMSDRA